MKKTNAKSASELKQSYVKKRRSMADENFEAVMAFRNKTIE